jgi:DNA polymerase
MNLVTLDFETYWSVEFSLTKINPIAYVLDDRFEVISCAVKEGDAPTDVVFGDDAVRERLSRIDWRKTMVVGHNMCGFDAYILAYRYGINPRMWGDTLCMARPRYSKTCGLSLAALVEHFHLGKKDKAVLLNTKGKRLADFNLSERDAMMRYNRADTDQCHALFRRLAKELPAEEMLLIDLTCRMATEPAFVMDMPLLKTALAEEKSQKIERVMALHAALIGSDASPEEPGMLETIEAFESVRSMLASNPKFAAFLESRGVRVPMKTSPTTGKETYAFGKTDPGFRELEEHEDPVVALAVSARMGVKSTLLETRIETLLQVGAQTGGKLPCPLKYCGADTTGRWSGDAWNVQNFPRIKPGNVPANALRMMMKAPEGHAIIMADLSGIELRVNHFLWKVPESTTLFTQDPEHTDLYKVFASRLYGVPVEEVTKAQRQIGKVAHLGLGFGAGAVTFQRFAHTTGGVVLPLYAEDAPEGADTAESIVTTWRNLYPEICNGWRTCHTRLQNIQSGIKATIDPWGMCETHHGEIRLPSGRSICYPDLGQAVGENGRMEWWYGMGRNRARIYAGKVCENIVQALARDVIAGYLLDYFRATRLRPALTVHDELVYIVPEAEAEQRLAELLAVMRTPPKWWPELAVWAEGGMAQRYGEAK